ncbi:hypothetical protein HDV64DRAFT_259589 [Trichoderma sp. TUCIM 5745]
MKLRATLIPASLSCMLTHLQLENTDQMEIMSCTPCDALLLVTFSSWCKQCKGRGRSLLSQWKLTSQQYSTGASEAIAPPTSQSLALCGLENAKVSPSRPCSFPRCTSLALGVKLLYAYRTCYN